jgi:purine-binding chemotaxis protein CheW
MEEIRQYLTFRIAGEEYALSVSHIREILEVPRITRIPRMPDFMIGVINLRGSVVPLVDLKMKLGLGATEISGETAVIVIELPAVAGEDTKGKTLGIFADAVHKVLAIEKSDVEPAPTIGLAIDTTFIEGMGRLEGELITILAIGGIISARDIEEARHAAPEDESKTGPVPLVTTS